MKSVFDQEGIQIVVYSDEMFGLIATSVSLSGGKPFEIKMARNK